MVEMKRSERRTFDRIETESPAQRMIAAGDELGAARAALVDLYLAHRTPGEDYAACFTRIGAPGYATILANSRGQTGRV